MTVEAGGVKQTQEIGRGYGHYGAQNDRVVHFGLGTACVGKVTVRWPDSNLTEETFFVPNGQKVKLVQGTAPVYSP